LGFTKLARFCFSLEGNMDTTLFASIAGIIISLMCSFVPGLSPRWDALDGVKKRMIMAVLMLFLAVVAVGLSCFGITDIVVCDKNGIMAVVAAFISALVANQSAYQLTRGS
jgi:hypothetical protein